MITKKALNLNEAKLYLSKKHVDRIIFMEPVAPDEPIFINRPVELSCIATADIFYAVLSSDYFNGAFIVKSEGVTFNRIRIIGLHEVGDDLHQSGIIFNNGKGFCQVTNSYISGLNYCGIWQRDCDELLIAGRTKIYGTDAEAGHNYGAWIGGKTDRPEMKMYAIGNRFMGSRHAIGAHYGPNSYYAIGNNVSTTKHSFDRHNSNDGSGRAGLHTVISGNTFNDTNRLAFGLKGIPYDGGSIVFTGNKLNHASTRHVGEIGQFGQVWEQDARMPRNISIHSNLFKTQ